VRIPVADTHSHSNPVRGLGASRIASKFKREGGWFMALVSLSPWAYGIDFEGLESYARVVEVHLRECKEAEDEGLKVACLAGFHPADVDRLIDKYGMDPYETLSLGLKVVEYLEKLCAEGVLDGIGEVGRQHYKTSPERVLISSLIMERALQAARDHDCIIHLHLENAGKITVELVEHAYRRLGGNRLNIVFHHANPRTAKEATEKGYSASIPGIPRLVENVVSRLEPNYTLESDHIDDPYRPGAVTYPWDMALLVKRLAEKSIVEPGYLEKINIDLVEKLYHVTP